MSGAGMMPSSRSFPDLLNSEKYGTSPQPTKTSPLGRSWTLPMYCDSNVAPCEYWLISVALCVAVSSLSSSARDGPVADRNCPAPVISQQ